MGTRIPVEIGADASLSQPALLNGASVVALELPAGWTAAALTFQSGTGNSGEQQWRNLYEVTGEMVIGTAVVDANRRIQLDPARFLGLEWLRVRSGTSVTPVNQAAARSLALVVRSV
jgi:hypothetical protein